MINILGKLIIQYAIKTCRKLYSSLLSIIYIFISLLMGMGWKSFDHLSIVYIFIRKIGNLT